MTNNNPTPDTGTSPESGSQPGPIARLKSWYNDLSPDKRRNVVLGAVVATALVVSLAMAWLAGRVDENDEPYDPTEISAPQDVNGAGGDTGAANEAPRTVTDDTGGLSRDEDSPDDPVASNEDENATPPEDTGDTTSYREGLTRSLAFQSGLSQPDVTASNTAENDARVDAASRVTDTIVHDPNIGPDGFDEVAARFRDDAGLEVGESVAEVYNMFDMIDVNDDMVFASRASVPAIHATEDAGVYQIHYHVAAGMVPNVEVNPQNVTTLRDRMRGELDAAVDGGAGKNVTFTVDTNTNLVTVEPTRWW